MVRKILKHSLVLFSLLLLYTVESSSSYGMDEDSEFLSSYREKIKFERPLSNPSSPDVPSQKDSSPLQGSSVPVSLLLLGTPSGEGPISMPPIAPPPVFLEDPSEMENENTHNLLAPSGCVADPCELRKISQAMQEQAEEWHRAYAVFYPQLMEEIPGRSFEYPQRTPSAEESARLKDLFQDMINIELPAAQQAAALLLLREELGCFEIKEKPYLTIAKIYFIRGLYEEALHTLLTALNYFQAGGQLREFNNQSWHCIDTTLTGIPNWPYQGNRSSQLRVIANDIKKVLESKYYSEQEDWQKASTLAKKHFALLESTWTTSDPDLKGPFPLL